ncbi:ABC transporter permease [Jeotgalibacillus sp. R-1-5s-1]|uniref:ABC transporter permease n=1 Tax=Jeotgalibacillus sp. R-1-5s-1 TaxID=2555897 RepID=UPI00106BE467|nr:ABC transporter permease [Jeotgalibacillus sp. R-1-5s-1]TFE03439.1 ABC transporter permease [Jeotgalibacillus sp. R-1-5s-1]
MFERFSRFQKILIPLISVVLGLIVGAIIMLVSGFNPIQGYAALLKGSLGESFYIGETIRQITPYIFAGLAVAFAFRTGLFNIGVEGQLLVGWVASVWVGLAFDLPKIIHLPMAILAGALAGALWAFIPGILKARLRVHEVIVTIMMNYIALHFCNYLIRFVISDEQNTTDRVPESASLKSPFFETLTEFSTMHYGIFLALAAVIIYYIILERTTTGFELRSVGFNQNASEYAGMNVNRNIVLSMLISGAFAGLGGAMEGLGTFGYGFIHGAFSGVGFDGIAVALLGGNVALGIVFAAALFGILKQGALIMPLESGVPTELVEIVIAIIIFFVASSYIIAYLLQRLKKGAK